jgi:hypothetical protein
MRNVTAAPRDRCTEVRRGGPLRAAAGAALALAAAGLGLAAPAGANLVTELSYDDRLLESDYVVIATVKEVTAKVRDRFDSTATATVRNVIKGAPVAELVVLRQSRIAESDPHCCEVGATYLMFLARAKEGGRLYPVNGAYGMLRLGPATTSKLQVLPS